MGPKHPKPPKRPTKCKRKKRHSNSVQPPLEEDPDQAQPKRRRSGSEPPGEASTSAEVNLPARTADEYWTISDNDVTSTTTLGEEPPSVPYDPSSEIPTSPVLEKLQIDNMPFESDAYFERVPLALSPVTIPQPSSNRNDEYYTEPTADDTLTPRPPIEDEPKPSTSGLGKTGKPWRTVEEDVQREEKEKYKQLLKLLKDKYSRCRPTPKPTSCNVEVYTKESLSAVTYLEEQRCGGDASRLLTPKPDGSDPPYSPERGETSYCTPAEREDKKRRERRASSGRQRRDESSGEASFELHLAPVPSRRPPVPDAEEKKSPGSARGERFPPLTEAMEGEIAAALGEGKPDEIMSSAFKLKLTREDIQTLNDLHWLNDEVVNFYMNLLMERGKKEQYPRVYAFSTFFYPRLLSEGYRAVKRWTRNVNLFKQDIILVPIHLRSHWTLVVVDLRKKTITYFDSFGKRGDKICETVFQYLQEESWEKQKVKLSPSEWTLHSMESHEIPQQSNGSDCGVFMCKYADYVSRDKPITFTENDMPYFRKRMVWEIIHQQLL